jgi:hypothetical protein
MLALQRIEMALDKLARVLRKERAHRVLLDIHAGDRCRTKHVSLAGAEPVEPHRQQPAERTGYLVEGLVPEGGEHLLGEERVSPRHLDDSTQGSRRDRTCALEDEALEISGRERTELQTVLPFPRGPKLDQLGPPEADEEDPTDGR